MPVLNWLSPLTEIEEKKGMKSGTAYSTVLNQLYLDVSFLHSLKTSENQWYKNGTLSDDGLIVEGHFAIFETFALY